MMRWESMLSFQVHCDRLGLTTPPPILRGIELLEVAESHAHAPRGKLLGMTDDEARERITALAIRDHQGFQTNTRGMLPGIEEFRDTLVREVHAASLPFVDELIVELRPRFDEAAAPLVDAAQTWGFSMQTTSDDVINLADEAASEAWRAARDAWQAVTPFATFRKAVSEIFDLSPTHEEAKHARGLQFAYDPSIYPLDYSVCFAEGHGWSWDGRFNVAGKPGAALDWFAIAAGGIRLNTPAEVQEKIAAKAALKAGSA